MKKRKVERSESDIFILRNTISPREACRYMRVQPGPRHCARRASSLLMAKKSNFMESQGTIIAEANKDPVDAP